MNPNDQLLKWAIELQGIAQAGLYYGKDPFDHERYQRVRDIAADMLALKTDIDLAKVKELFCGEVGYQTPKLETRAAIFQEHKILLVKELNGLWSMPGGWVDASLSPAESAVKEVREEAGLEVSADLVIAVQDRQKHNTPMYVYNICKIIFLCTVIGGAFVPNAETSESGYFALDALPPLSLDRNTKEQIELCFEARRSASWRTRFD